MSVINQMLRDLDARDASAQERAGLPPRLRTLPPLEQARNQQWRILGLGIGIGALAAGVAAYLLSGSPPPAIPVATPPAPAPVVTPTPVPATADDSAMKLSTLIAKPEPPPAAPKPAAAPAPAAKPVAPAVTEPKRAPAPAHEAAADTQIDKRPKGGAGGQAREMADAEYRKGMQAMKRGDSAAAHPAFQRALELDPLYAKARQALLSVLVGGKQWAEARQVAEAGLALDPGQSGWAMILARLQFEQGDTAGAVSTLERHAANAAGDADYQGLFAYLLQKQQRPAEAAERFKLALALRPSEGRWWFGLGLALETAGKAGEAREAYAKAREIGNLPADMATVIEQKLR